ncbi:hypothetical protein HMPREF1640_12540 [Prevotella sp. S7-1-8]|nr:hypothetical protein HMPREF1640_12540 [Prevotella sp. S7-1-8]
MLFKMAFLKHFEEQGKTTKRCYFLIYELYVTVAHWSIYFFRGKVSKCLWIRYIRCSFFLMAVIRK